MCCRGSFSSSARAGVASIRTAAAALHIAALRVSIGWFLHLGVHLASVQCAVRCRGVCAAANLGGFSPTYAIVPSHLIGIGATVRPALAATAGTTRRCATSGRGSGRSCSALAAVCRCPPRRHPPGPVPGSDQRDGRKDRLVGRRGGEDAPGGELPFLKARGDRVEALRREGPAPPRLDVSLTEGECRPLLVSAVFQLDPP